VNLEKIVVRTTGGGLLFGAISLGLGVLLGVPLLVSLGQYALVAVVTLGLIIPLAAIIAIVVTGQRPP
jgi:hypothetical protein